MKSQGYVTWESILKKANEKAVCTQPGSMEQLRKKEKVPGKKRDQIEKSLKFSYFYIVFWINSLLFLTQVSPSPLPNSQYFHLPLRSSRQTKPQWCVWFLISTRVLWQWPGRQMVHLSPRVWTLQIPPKRVTNTWPAASYVWHRTSGDRTTVLPAKLHMKGTLWRRVCLLQNVASFWTSKEPNFSLPCEPCSCRPRVGSLLSTSYLIPSLLPTEY